MTDIHAQSDPSEATFCIEGTNAHLFYDGNTGARRELFANLKEDQCQIRYITEKMESLVKTMDSCLEDAMKYEDLSEELKKTKQKASKDEKIIRALADRNVEKIYVYE